MYAKAKLSPANQVRRIVALFNRATPEERQEGMEWYAKANAFAKGLADHNGLTLRQTAGIVAALSPQVSWEVNQTIALKAASGRRYTGQTGPNMSKASRIRNGEDPSEVLFTSEKSGQKVRAFFACIESPETTDAVCIDRHAYSLAEGLLTNDDRERSNALRRKGVYATLEASYREAARILGVRPHEVQAVTWIVWRNLKNDILPPPAELAA
jgi:hypothetical protein